MVNRKRPDWFRQLKEEIRGSEGYLIVGIDMGEVSSMPLAPLRCESRFLEGIATRYFSYLITKFSKKATHFYVFQ